MKKGTIFFDFDGTIHETMYIYGPALDVAKKYLDEHKIPYQGLEENLYHTYLGYNADDMWQMVMGGNDKETIHFVSSIVGREMNSNLDKGLGRLYPKTEETLLELKERGYTLVYISNARNTYYEKVKENYKLDRFFDGFLTSQMYNELPKEEILKSVKHKYPVPYYIVGDRFFDMVGGQKNNMTTIFCNYGYGKPEEGKDASYRIDSIDELLEVMRLEEKC
ncbi:HAD family hydrolase [Peptoniphilus duerdenii]|uniref:HAD family hydrolase n=1 Tax=Peptoniphilus duerdenii TaxID=507750 RepID=UPI00288C2E28|nr:HAD family hydrolase [Peptoniphilus duerdenii]